MLKALTVRYILSKESAHFPLMKLHKNKPKIKRFKLSKFRK